LAKGPSYIGPGQACEMPARVGLWLYTDVPFFFGPGLVFRLRV
jgi:hypothetical protein